MYKSISGLSILLESSSEQNFLCFGSYAFQPTAEFKSPSQFWIASLQEGLEEISIIRQHDNGERRLQLINDGILHFDLVLSICSTVQNFHETLGNNETVVNLVVFNHHDGSKFVWISWLLAIENLESDFVVLQDGSNLGARRRVESAVKETTLQVIFGPGSWQRIVGANECQCLHFKDIYILFNID